MKQMDYSKSFGYFTSFNSSGISFDFYDDNDVLITIDGKECFIPGRKLYKLKNLFEHGDSFYVDKCLASKKNGYYLFNMGEKTYLLKEDRLFINQLLHAISLCNI